MKRGELYCVKPPSSRDPKKFRVFAVVSDRSYRFAVLDRDLRAGLHSV